MSVIFKLDTTDWSWCVVADSYNVNYENVYNEWIDGGQVKHRDVIRRRLVGTFQMHFPTESDLQDFIFNLNMIEEENHTYLVYLKNNNNDIEYLTSTYVFLDFKPVRRRSPSGEDAFDTFEVSIEEP